MEKRGEFPRRIVLTSRSVAWDMAEVQAWIKARQASNAKAKAVGATLAAA